MTLMVMMVMVMAVIVVVVEIMLMLVMRVRVWLQEGETAQTTFPHTSVMFYGRQTTHSVFQYSYSCQLSIFVTNCRKCYSMWIYLDRFDSVLESFSKNWNLQQKYLKKTHSGRRIFYLHAIIWWSFQCFFLSLLKKSISEEFPNAVVGGICHRFLVQWSAADKSMRKRRMGANQSIKNWKRRTFEKTAQWSFMIFANTSCPKQWDKKGKYIWNFNQEILGLPDHFLYHKIWKKTYIHFLFWQYISKENLRHL